jgi:hypothetical protein
VNLPFDQLFRVKNRLTDGWKLWANWGNPSRRFFYSPRISNFDMTLTKLLRITESKSLEFRVEAFNAFTHDQFYGPRP